MRVNETKEKEAIKQLKKLAKIWPNSLWLFAANGSLNVMRKNPDGSRATCGVGGEGMDPDSVVANIDIECDGGDW